MEMLLAILFGLAIGAVVGTVGGGGAILALPVLVFSTRVSARPRLPRSSSSPSPRPLPPARRPAMVTCAGEWR